MKCPGAVRRPLVVLGCLVAITTAACSVGATEPTGLQPDSTSSTLIADPPDVKVSTTTTEVATTGAAVTSINTSTTTLPPPPTPTFGVFMPRGLADGFADLAGDIDGVMAVGLVHTETLHIVETRTEGGVVVDQPADGFVIPVQGAALDPTDHGVFITQDVRDLLVSLGPDEVLLSAGSASLRGIGAGGTIVFESGREVTVAGVVADRAFGGEELVTTDPELVGGAGSELRFAVVQFDGSEDQLTEALGSALPEGAGFGVHPRGRPEDQTTAVRNQVWIKQTFGEFSYRPSGTGRFTIDPTWVEENIIVATVPLLGTARCHRRYIEVLTEAMTLLIEAANHDSIDRSAFLGCWNARYVANSMRLSRHSWGAAADINFFNSLDGGAGSPVNQALLDAMAQVGITSGHDWSIPDPGHFEYYGFPEDE